MQKKGIHAVFLPDRNLPGPGGKVLFGDVLKSLCKYVFDMSVIERVKHEFSHFSGFYQTCKILSWWETAE
jgi:hypothetical protein